MKATTLLVCLAACKAPVPRIESETTTPSTPASASASASVAALPAAVPQPHATFTSVIVATKGEHLNLYPVGSRALIELGTGFWGYAVPRGTPVHDGSVADGLPSAGKSHIQAVGGVWPDVAVAFGEKELAEYAGPNSVLYLRHGAFAASKASFPDVPRSATSSKGVTHLFVPDSMHFIGGQDVAQCGKSAPEELPVLAIRGDKPIASPRGVPSFFAQALQTDGSGNGFVVGGDMCRAGAFIASLDASPVRLELVPSSDACTARTNTEGMPFTHARLFPSSGGGLYALLVNREASPYVAEEAKLRTGACAAPPRVLERQPDGHWSAPRALPENVTYIDPSGTAWAITDHQTVSRIPEVGGPTEVTLDSSCTHPPITAKPASEIVSIVVPFPDQPWITVAYDASHTGLCVAQLDVP